MVKIMNCVLININRNFSNVISMVIALLIIPLVVVASFYINNLNGKTTKIAIVGDEPGLISYLEENNIPYVAKKEKPNKEDIYLRRYVGTIVTDGQDETIISYNGKKVEKYLAAIVGRMYEPVESGNGFPKAFYLNLCIILIQAVLNMKMFISDRRNNIINRLYVMGFGRNKYLLSYLIFNWIALFIPYSLSNIICNIVYFGSTFMESMKILLICFVVTGLFASIALLICACVKDNASAIMVGNIIACFTALLSGMFGKWENKALQVISDFMPQKLSYSWVEKIYNGGGIINIYFIAIICLFAIITVATSIIYKQVN